MDVPDPDDDEKTLSLPHFVSGTDLATLVRRERAKLLHAFSTQSDVGSRFQEAGNWAGAEQAYTQVIKLANDHKPPDNPTFENESICLSRVATAGVNHQLAKVMWVAHNYHWQMMSAMECAVKDDPTNPKYRAFQQLFRYPFNEDAHALTRQDPDMLSAISELARKRPEQALNHVGKALQRQPDDPILHAFKAYLETHEREAEFDFG